MDGLERELCAAFCGDLAVHPVATGYAVSSAFKDASGDRISFYIVETPDGFRLEDDGDYLAGLVARDVPFSAGARSHMLDAILQEGGAYWDRDTFEIRTDSFPRHEMPTRAIAFLSSVIRSRDIALVTRDRVRSAFREDFINVVRQYLDNDVIVEENTAPTSMMKEFPADVVLTPRVRSASSRIGSVYLINSNDKLNEALLAWTEARSSNDGTVAVIAMVEDRDLHNISRMKFQRAQNRALPMPIFRGDEHGAMRRIAMELGIKRAA